MYNLRYSYILTFLLFQFIGEEAGYDGGHIVSHNMSGNVIYIIYIYIGYIVLYMLK